MPSPSEPPRPAALTREQANEVLRYWLASLQLEEALASRPRARRPLASAPPLRLDAPTPGQEYFKLPLDATLESLLRARGSLQKPFDAELGAFFESWLVSQYRRGGEDRELSHLLAFPVVHLPRGELAGLLRYGVRVSFNGADGAAFEVPTRSHRRRKVYPPPPSQVRLAGAAKNGQKWPFFVDTRLLQQQLGIPRESIDAFFDALREQPEIRESAMLEKVCELLEAELPPSAAKPASLLERLFAAVSGLCARRGGRARGYPVAIVLDGTRTKTTWYLQRELQALLEGRPEVAWDLDSCLGAYLTGRKAEASAAVQRALFPSVAMSPSQRDAAERVWGSKLTAVQGPPGTGKTTLILHLAAETLVRQVDGLAARGVMGHDAVVVTSTNNRAVDNLVDPLNAHGPDGLPLALRAGSQRVCEHVLGPQLAQTRAWLERARLRPEAERAVALDAALAGFSDARARLDAALGPRARLLDAAARRTQLRAAIADLDAEVAGPAGPLDAARIASLTGPLERLRDRLRSLCELCDVVPSLPALNAVDRHFRKTAKRALPELHEAFAQAGLALDLELPPALPPSTQPAVLMDAWGDAAGAALGRVEACFDRFERALLQSARRVRRSQLQAELAALGPEEAVPPPSSATAEPLSRALFEAAVQVREAWAAAESEALLPVISDALEAARSEASLRPLWADPASYRALHQLFGVWGCTLLSLGNCFPPHAETVARVIVDEAGQCHPAYAVSALLRGQTALIIGDVHQLEPVIDLEIADDERVIDACKLSLPLEMLAPYRVHAEAQSSVQSLADRAVVDRPRLIDHFRCQPEIIAISDALCGYGLRVHTPREGPAVPIPFLPHPVSFIDVAGEQERLGGSWQNSLELAVTLELVQALLAAGLDPAELAVITPYRGQLEQLRKQFLRSEIPLAASLELLELEDAIQSAAVRGMAAGTVHRFQGGERSVVVFTSVVTRRASLGFLDDRENLLNVAVSRARHRFIGVGRSAVLATGRRTSLLTRAAAPLAVDAFRTQLGLSL